jgi:branched-chain amino acid aminotransferase
VDPRVKNYHWLDFVMGLFEAYKRGAETVVLTDGVGQVCEGPGFNVFAVFGRSVVTPSAGVLEGITRRTMIELARREGFDMQVRALSVEELRRADEVFLSSTGGGAIAVHSLDGAAIGGRAAGDFGPVTQRLQAAYWALHDDARYAEPVIGLRD